MGRIALGIEYDGASVHGWQRQKDVASVQEYLEKALTVIANKPIIVFCAGRTDAGVHATGQIVHFDSDVERPERAWTLGINANMPDTIAVTWAKPVSDDFHARFDALEREYTFRLLVRRAPSAHEAGLVWQVSKPLDIDAMREGATPVSYTHLTLPTICSV